MAASDRNLSALYQIVRILEQKELTASERIERLYQELFENEDLPTRQFRLSRLDQWENEALTRALHYAENIITRYTHLYYDPRVIPVTYYQRERRIRRHLDHQFSMIFKELIRRAGNIPIIELITEEPIYYLKQQAREKRFPRSGDGRASLETLRSRFHLALSHRLAG